ncbi:MAG TPA: Fe-S protein assembly co-chaperone HscB [Nitrospiraceae bacterium]|nr:Fe-S protein assembly co-chaperone HscB [Nitrospiraceae bacterium]
MARSMCWHCQSEVTGEYFCDRCVKVQPLSKESDYFTCFGLPRLLTIDGQALETKFYELSRAFHPDFFQRKTDAEQAISLGNSALLNTAYRTLKDPIRRAEYLVQLEAGSVKDIRTSPPADLFEEILELQEDLDEFRTASSDDQISERDLRAKLMDKREHLERRQQAMESDLRSLFATWDRLQTQDDHNQTVRTEKDATLKHMREILSNRTYLRNIVNDLTATIG